MKAAPNLPTAAVVSPLACAASSIVGTRVSLPWYESRTASTTPKSSMNAGEEKSIMLPFRIPSLRGGSIHHVAVELVHPRIGASGDGSGIHHRKGRIDRMVVCKHHAGSR